MTSKVLQPLTLVCYTPYLQLDDSVHEVLLQLLVGEVDAQLLEGIEAEVLEAEDVEQPNVLLAVFGDLGRARQRLVHLADDPIEDVDVDSLSTSTVHACSLHTYSYSPLCMGLQSQALDLAQGVPRILALLLAERHRVRGVSPPPRRALACVDHL